MDARSAVLTLGVRGDSRRGADLEMVLRHTAPAVRPDDVLTALSDVSDLTPTAPPLMKRLAQGSFGESGMVQL
jgi:hypothetical protein